MINIQQDSNLLRWKFSNGHLIIYYIALTLGHVRQSHDYVLRQKLLSSLLHWHQNKEWGHSDRLSSAVVVIVKYCFQKNLVTFRGSWNVKNIGRIHHKTDLLLNLSFFFHISAEDIADILKGEEDFTQ